MKEWYFVARVEKFEISTDNFTEEEKKFIGTYQWWSLPELKTTTDESLSNRSL